MIAYNDEPLQVACLGRPLELGMLYDCRSERVIPGITLWGKDVLKNNVSLKKRENSMFEVITDDSLESKAHIFDMEGGLKLSFLCGLIPVEGSAKYLENKKSSLQQARVTLRYRCNTFFEQLTMDQLADENIQFKDVFSKGTATHVVTGVQYGADAVFVFDREVSTSEDARHVEGSMKGIIDKISTTHIEGGGLIKTTDEEEIEVNKFRCTFHGDVLLKENPTTFEDAVNVYRNLPKLIMDTATSTGEICGVPKKVYLHPLSKLDNSAAKLVQIISADLVTKTQELLEALSTLQVSASDLMNEEASRKFPGIREQLVTFRSLVSRFTSEFQQKLVDILPKIRAGDMDEGILAAKVKALKQYPFHVSKLETWIQGKKQESKVIQQYLTSLKEYPFASQAGDLEQYSHDRSIKKLLGLSFGSIASKSHPFLEEMAEYCDSAEDVTDSCESYEDHWFNNDNTVSALRKQADLFVEFATINKDDKSFKCIVLAGSDRKNVALSPGDTFLYIDGLRKPFQPPSSPGIPEVECVSEYEMAIKWEAPNIGVKHIVHYCVMYQDVNVVDQETWLKAYSEYKESNCHVTELKPNTSYKFKVAAISEAGMSQYGPVSQPITTKSLPSLAKGIIEHCVLLSEPPSSCPAWYQLPLTRTYHNQNQKLQRYETGEPHPEGHGIKVMLVVGATGSGKTTLINGMINYLFGVHFEDGYRLKLVNEDFQNTQADSQTQYMTAYTIHWQPGSMIPYTLVIIDTPGFGDTRGIEQDDKITQQIREFFEMSGSEAIDQLDAVGFVSQASVARLTDTQKYVFDSILSIFGKDISDNIFMMLTFADGRPPPALDAIKAHNLPYRQYFKFNNSVFTQVTSSSKQKKLEHQNSSQALVNQSFEALFWKLAAHSFSQFFESFRKVEPRSLKLTREVLGERQRLEISIESFQRRINSGVNHLVKMRQELQFIEEYEAEKSANKQFTRTVQVPKSKRVKFEEQGVYVTNCLKCNVTCHMECSIPDDGDKFNCMIMRNFGKPDASCTFCSLRCHWKHHVNRDYYFEDYMEEEVVTMDDLKKKYDLADKNLSEKGNLIAGIAQEYNKVQIEVLQDVESVRKSLLRLDEIAMKRNPLTTVEYIDIMIRSAKNEKKYGWEQRLDQLENARKRAEMIEKMMIEGKEYDPFKELREELEQASAKSPIGDKSIKSKLKNFFGFRRGNSATLLGISKTRI